MKQKILASIFVITLQSVLIYFVLRHAGFFK